MILQDMSIPDRVDERIVLLLGHDARQNSEALAKELGLSAATVRRRLRRLIGGDLLRVVGVIDPAQFGFPVAAVVAIDADTDLLVKIIDRLAAEPEIKWISATTGRFDIMIYGRFRSTDELSDFLAARLSHIEGIRDTETFICLDVKKGRFTTLG